MPKISRMPNGVIFVFEGEVLPAHIFEAAEVAAGHQIPDFKWSLWDYSKTTFSDAYFWSESLLEAFAAREAPLYAHQTWPHRFPHVATDWRVRNLIASYQAKSLRPPSHQLKLFRSFDEALTWAQEI